MLFLLYFLVYAEEIITQETDQSEFSYEPEIHVEEVDHWILLGDEDEAVDKGTPPKRAPGARAVSSSCSSYWQYLLSQQFGDEYLSPALVTDGVSVNGVTNRMTISENDLTLPGRHGLNVELIREYDSQRTEAEWRAERNDIALTASHRWIMYTFTDENSGNTYNIAVESEDDYYVFNMDAGIYLTKIDTRYILKKKVDDGFVYFYRFSDLYSYQTNDESAEYHLIPIANSRWNFTYSERESALYSLKSSRVRYSGVDLGMGWSIKLPYAYQLRSEYNRYASSSYTDYESRFNGVFRTIQGELVTFAGYTLVRNKNDGTATFTSSYNTENNRFCNITTYYEEQQLDDSPELLYNFKVYDSRGFTYYLKSVASVLHDSTWQYIMHLLA